MQRVKNIDYDEDELYSEEEDHANGGEEYTTEGRDNFATYTPVVRAELEEAGLQASDREIEDALWHYYWDVGKSVAYLKNTRTPRPQQDSAKKFKPKSKFDQAAEKSAEKAGESRAFPRDLQRSDSEARAHSKKAARGVSSISPCLNPR